MRPGTYHAREGFNWIRARKGLHFRLLFSFRCGRRIQTSVEVCHLQNCDFNWSRMPSDSQRAQNSGVSSSGSDPRRPALKNGAGSTDIARVSLRSLCRKVLGCGLITGSATKTQNATLSTASNRREQICLDTFAHSWFTSCMLSRRRFPHMLSTFEPVYPSFYFGNE